MKTPQFKINWVPGPNTKPWKKLFPIMNCLNDDDLILLIDDDLAIRDNLIEMRVKEFNEYGGNFAISGGGRYTKTHLNIPLVNGHIYNTICPTSLI